MRHSSRRRSPPPAAIQLFLDVDDDLRVLRAVEAFAGRRRGAIVVRPTPGSHGSQNLCRDVLSAAAISATLHRGTPAGSTCQQTGVRLRRARVRELWVLRAHTIENGGWGHLGLVAAVAGARLMLVIHTSWPCPHRIAGLRAAGFCVAGPRVIHLTQDTLSLALGVTPVGATPLAPLVPVTWLPAVPVR